MQIFICDQPWMWSRKIWKRRKRQHGLHKWFEGVWFIQNCSWKKHSRPTLLVVVEVRIPLLPCRFGTLAKDSTSNLCDSSQGQEVFSWSILNKSLLCVQIQTNDTLIIDTWWSEWIFVTSNPSRLRRGSVIILFSCPLETLWWRTVSLGILEVVNRK